jgi:hypothetical protein
MSWAAWTSWSATQRSSCAEQVAKVSLASFVVLGWKACSAGRSAFNEEAGARANHDLVHVQITMEQENKFEVDPDWVMPELEALVPDGGHLSQDVRKLDSTYFDTPMLGCDCLGSRCGVGLEAARLAGS